MAKFDYTATQILANRLIDKFGGTLYIRRTTTTDAPIDPWNVGTTETITDHEVFGALLNYRNQDIDGTKIQQQDKQALVSAKGLSIEPTTNDLVIVKDDAGVVIDSYQIVMPNPLRPNPQGPVVYWDLQLRK